MVAKREGRGIVCAVYLCACCTMRAQRGEGGRVVGDGVGVVIIGLCARMIAVVVIAEDGYVRVSSGEREQDTRRGGGD